jgi:hypothetical protein
MVIYSFLPSLL